MIRYINLIFFAGMLVMNYLANALPLNGKTTGQISDNLPNLFTPAGITFSVWGVIYILLAIFCILQFTAQGRETAISAGWIFALSCVFNAAWIVAWHYEKLPLSLLLMIGLLISLIYLNLHIKDLSLGWLKAAFGIYLGWICIASIANVTAVLVNTGWNGFGIPEVTWTIIMIAAGTLIVTLALLRLNNPFIGVVAVWAFLGIIIKRQADYRLIVVAAAVAILVVGVFTFKAFIRR
ncbi:MAG: tryptophan-rich sensory protein [Bacteroidales bacterium]|nr:tryptophan-rich sensory protein [Bacteroidales bacterium]